MNSYELSRKWFDFAFDNASKVKPLHTALYFFIVEHNNRLGWKKEFGFPRQMAMDALGVKNDRTYSNCFEDLNTWGFIIVYERSKNQYSSNIIGLVKNTIATTKALDEASLKHLHKHVDDTTLDIVAINKHINLQTIKQINHKTKEFCDFINKNLELIFGENKNSFKIHFEEAINAYQFLQKESPSRLETFEMQNKKSFENYEVFKTNFNSKVITEEIPISVNILMARLEQLNANWNKEKSFEKKEKSISLADKMKQEYGIN